MRNYSNSPEDYPEVKRLENSFNWKLVILAIILIAVIFYWPLLYEFVSSQIELTRQAEISQPSKKNNQELPYKDRPLSFDAVLDAALRYSSEGDRKQAGSLFSGLLRQAAKNVVYNEQMAALLPRAADFFSKGDEIPAEQVENLYLDAIDAINKVHGRDHYDLENVYLGLETHYLSLNRYKEAAIQTGLLLEFYRRYYKDNEDALFSVIKPTTIRHGHNLLAAGQNTEARNAYQSALKMTSASHQPVSAIEEFIKKTYQQGENISSSMAEIPQISVSRGANIPSVTPAPSSSDATKDIKRAIEAISLPGIDIKQLQEKDDRINITGYADDNKTVAKYLRLLLEKVGEPTLEMVTQEERGEKHVSAFIIKMKK